jgi:hypothetical protein
MRELLINEAQSRPSRLPVALKFALLALFVGLTNFGFLERITLLAGNGRLLDGIVPYVAIVSATTAPSARGANCFGMACEPPPPLA